MTFEVVDPMEESAVLGDILHACVEGGASVNFVQPFSREEARAYWQRPVDRIVLVAKREGRIVGTVSLIPARQPNQPHRAEVAKVLVHPDARRQGVARALLDEIEKVAIREGRTLLTLDTEAGSDAEGLYRSLGYVPFGVVPRFALDAQGERLIAAAFYYKHLDEKPASRRPQ